MDASLTIQEMSAYVFGHDFERFLHPLVRVKGSEEVEVLRLVRTLMGSWKLMALGVCEYVLAAPNVRVKGTIWSLGELCAIPMSLMVVTVVSFELSDVEVKDGLTIGSKGVLLEEHKGS